MKRSIIFWTIALMITVVSAYYQRMTGPTRPVGGKLSMHEQTFKYSFDRSHAGNTNASVTLPVDDPEITGVLEWKRYKTDDEWTAVPLERVESTLHGELPLQPPAGKLQYRVKVAHRDSTTIVPSENGVVMRFKGDVPIPVLVIHVIFMFTAMLLSTRTGLEFFNPNPRLKKLIPLTLGFLFVGGLILGPIVQKYAFGAFWTGWPFGTDLTDNKTLIAWVSWFAALIALYRSKVPARWALAAAVITIAVYVIPHSALGSELDYRKMQKKGTQDTIALPRQ